ncbi:peptidoglycan DD-metalloendopeptidase family protein [Clostridium weizhouense]|uniref:Peptidoglycan DD-metalloendopeptidase family protein n=1 Tax=Clostridium weizhouense TaxID=2859781 RepID=A0ABS7ATB9_9CLOT|nr:M23 family metallopeptidase [Clostridium weizhouense]MBW6411907.1 peptidoglycan DD-metalloendopeptidase family protein [Clostridium weizhouense]
MDTRKTRKIKFIICIILLLNSINLVVNADTNRIYEAYVDNRLIGYIDNKNTFRNTYKDTKEELNNRIGSKCIRDKKIKFKSTDLKSEISTKEEIESNIIKTIDTEVNAQTININDKNCGTLFNKNEVNEAIKKFTNEYLKNMNINIDNVLEVSIDSDFKTSEEKVPISQINNINQIVDNINNDPNIKDNINIDVKVKEDKEVSIEPQTTIKQDESMYVGESKIIEDGESGSKHVLSEVIYHNGNKLKENIISEDILKNAKDRVECIGTKSPIGSNTAFLQAPTRGGWITSKFGARWGRNHNGIDIAGNTGDPVTAAYDGTIQEAGQVSGYGNMIKIKHQDNIETIYGHLSSIKVKKGQKVKKGDIIGCVGSTGRSTGPHLHFELRSKGKPINPEGYILNN